MFKIKYLELEGFRSFVDKTRIDFPEKGLILISGKYKDSGVSSGSGKSSIIEAITFALDICNIPATELKSWYSKSLYVKLGLINGSQIIEIERTPKMSLFIDGEPYSELSTGAKEKLYEILGVPATVLAQVSYREQREKGVFFNSTDSELKKFLSKVLNLDKIESKSEELRKRAAQTSMSIDLVKRETATINQYSQSLAVSDSEISLAESAFSEAQSVLNSMKPKDNSEKYAEIEAIDMKISEVRSKLRKIDEDSFKKLNILRKIEMISYQNNELRHKLTQLLDEKAKISESLCPTCENKLSDLKTLDMVKAKDLEIDAKTEQFSFNLTHIKALQIELESFPDLDSNKNDLQLHIDRLNEHKSHIIANMNADKSYELASTAAQSALQHLERLKKTKSDYDSSMKRVSFLQDELEKLKSRYEIEDLSAMILGRGGFLAFIFEETLMSIQNRANSMIRDIQNIECFDLEISMTKEVKGKKTSKEEISKVIRKAGQEVSFRSLSGGQKAAMEFVTDLSTAKEIKQKSGSGVGWLLLDEALDGLGPEEKLSAIEIVKSNFDGQVIMIDHATEIKELFTQVVEVEYDGQKSSIKPK